MTTTVNTTPPKDKKELVAWANKLKDAGYATPEFQAKQNLSFFLGRQWDVWNPAIRRFDTPTPHRGDPNAPVRVTVNKIAGIGERVIARLMKTAPIPECRPVTDTAADVNSAKVGTRILDHEWNRLELEQILMELYFWVVPVGWSFLHVRWNPDAGSLVGEDQKTGAPVRQGEVTVEEVPAFELRVDPNARHFRDAQWCCRTTAMTKEAVFEQYGIVPEGATTTDSLSSEWRFGDLDEGRRGSGGLPHAKSDNQFVAVHQLWVLPSRANPQGLVVTWAGTTVLDGPLDFPYDHGRLPFIAFNLLPALGSGPAGRTWVTDLISLQKDYNDARSREATQRRVMTPKILAAKGQIDADRVSSRVEVISYNPTGPDPKWLIPDSSWLAQYETAMNRSDQEMGERAGQNDATSGNAASSAAAATVMALQEADETKLAISSKELAMGVKALGWQILMLVKQFWSESRTVRTWSREGELEVAQFSGSDLENQLDVHVSSESSLPRSKAARTQLAIDLRREGVLGQDPRTFLRLLDIPGTDLLLETLNIDAKHAEREHAKIYAGETVEVQTWHNGPVHIQVHGDEMKSEEYENKTPEEQAAFYGHLMAHLEVEQAKMMSAAQMAGGGIEDTPGAENPSGANGEPIDPLTGKPRDPNTVLAGMAPSDLRGSTAAGNAGVVGGMGNPGPVPGQNRDDVAYRTGN